MERKIELPYGMELDDVIAMLLEAKANGEHVYCDYNNHIFHSDTITVDDAYIKVYGCTKALYDLNKMMEDDRRETLEWNESITRKLSNEKVDELIEEGKKYIYPEKYGEWEKYVRGPKLTLNMDVVGAIEIMKALEDGASLEEAKEIFNKQMHNTLSKGASRSVIFEFCKRGPEFIEAISDDLSIDDRIKIEKKKKENLELAEKHNKNNQLPSNEWTGEYVRDYVMTKAKESQNLDEDITSGMLDEKVSLAEDFKKNFAIIGKRFTIFNSKECGVGYLINGFDSYGSVNAYLDRYLYIEKSRYPKITNIRISMMNDPEQYETFNIDRPVMYSKIKFSDIDSMVYVSISFGPNYGEIEIPFGDNVKDRVESFINSEIQKRKDWFTYDPSLITDRLFRIIKPYLILNTKTDEERKQK